MTQANSLSTAKVIYRQMDEGRSAPEQMSQFKYLGSTQTTDETSAKEVAIKQAQALLTTVLWRETKP